VTRRNLNYPALAGKRKEEESLGSLGWGMFLNEGHLKTKTRGKKYKREKIRACS